MQNDVTAFRYAGGESEDVGRFLTTRQTALRISNPGEAMTELNLPNGSTAERLNSFIIPKGTTIQVGRVAGGGQTATQIFVRKANVLRSLR